MSFLLVNDLNILSFFVLYSNNDFFALVIKGTLLATGEKTEKKISVKIGYTLCTKQSYVLLQSLDQSINESKVKV